MNGQETASLRYRLGVDIGGTFTDGVLWDAVAERIYTVKLPTTPDDVSVGFLNVVGRALSEHNIDPSEVELVVHGTTVATNAVIQGETARTAFVTTKGFRDMLEIARQIRPSLYDLSFEKPPVLISRDRCFEVDERLDAQGGIVRPIDPRSVDAVIDDLERSRVESVAVCLLHAYANTAHERLLASRIEERLPHLKVSLSADICQEFREYFRASTTVINASIRPIISNYLVAISERLVNSGLRAQLLVMQSNGGVMSFADASERPVYLVESGPAAGVIAAIYHGKRSGHIDLITLDMGGTTAKASLVRNLRPEETKDYEVGSHAVAGQGGVARGGGYPIRTPVIDLVEIGAGGGSLAWVDDGGALRVGPKSAAASPGPACYGKGGADPTVTDANVVLGRLNPDNFLGGEMSLDLNLAQQAIEAQCATPLNMGVVESAYGIIELANNAMANAVHLVTVQRGHDPRNFALVAFGGAGPLHANRIAAMLGVPRVVIPPSPGTTSALGLLATDLRHDYSRTLRTSTRDLSARALRAALNELEVLGAEALRRDGVDGGRMSFKSALEMRYSGQGHELTVPVPDIPSDDRYIGEIEKAFHEAHERAYGYSAPHESAVIVNIRVTALGLIAKPKMADATPAGNAVESSVRKVYFSESGGFTDCAIFARATLAPGYRADGPAVIEEIDSTTVVHPGFAFEIDSVGNIIISEAQDVGGAVNGR